MNVRWILSIRPELFGVCFLSIILLAVGSNPYDVVRTGALVVLIVLLGRTFAAWLWR